MKFLKKQALSWLLAISIAVGLCPISVFADEDTFKLSLSTGDMTIDKAESWDYNATLRLGSTDVTSSYSISWDTQAHGIATVGADGVVTGVSPGQTKLMVTAKDRDSGTVVAEAEAMVTVSGIVLDNYNIELLENERADLPTYTLFGEAKGTVITWTSSNVEVVRVSRDTYVDGLSVGQADITAKADGTEYSAKLSVTVKSNQALAIDADLGAGANLNFASLESKINTQCVRMTEGSLSSVTGLSVSTDCGILFLNYLSEEEPGAGVAQSGSYYISSAARGPYIRDITFVPNPYYTGDTVTINYTGVSSNKRSFNGRIVVTLEQVDNDLSMAATASSPARFTGVMFNEVCQRLTSSTLDTVTFSLPAGTRGTLYYDYVSDIDYDSKVELGKEYPLSKLDDICFVPAPGFTGTATIYYTGYTVSKQRYTGEIHITVTQPTEGGPVYNVGQGGVVSFDEGDFDAYCWEVLNNSYTSVDRVRFRLPSSDEGILYYDYKSSSNTGTRVSGVTNYYADRTPRINRITFVPNQEFSGTVKIPFTAWDENNTSFDGVVEINVRSTGSGDVTYACYPGSYVKFDRDDFEELCENITGRSLSYITFQTLPDGRDGVLYSNKFASGTTGTKVSRGTKYYYSNLSNLSFWAEKDFNRSVEVTFTGITSGGESFTGILRIEPKDYWGEEISYTTQSGKLVTFDAGDFNDMSWDATDAQLRYVNFTLPDKAEGVLYYNYKSGSNYNTKVTASSNYYYNSANYLKYVSFLPATGFSGMVDIPFKAYATNGQSFEGFVEIYVQAGSQGSDVTYTTTYAPVTFSASDFGFGVSSVEFGAMPNSEQGYLYYQYSGPNQYSWKASVGTQYKVNGSPRLNNLTFVPCANFVGEVTLPYTATDTSGHRYSGEVVIYVESSRSSAYFGDMGSYTPQAKAAVDFLYENGIVSGMGGSNYGPASSIRRGDFALMLYKAFNFYSPGSVQTFRDVPEDAYYAQAVHTLRSLGIVSGSGDNMYSPDRMLSRQDAMLMVQKALQVAGWSTRAADENLVYDYDDGTKVAPYAREAMAYVMQWDLLPVTGYQLAPTANLTRVDMAQVLHRALTY